MKERPWSFGDLQSTVHRPEFVQEPLFFALLICYLSRMVRQIVQSVDAGSALGFKQCPNCGNRLSDCVGPTCTQVGIRDPKVIAVDLGVPAVTRSMSPLPHGGFVHLYPKA